MNKPDGRSTASKYPVWDRDDALEILAGDLDFALLQLEKLKALLPGNLDELQRSLHANDLSPLHQEAHALKGNAASIGAKALAYAAKELDDSATADDKEQAALDLEAVEVEMRRLREFTP